jgi:hypothetical protein
MIMKTGINTIIAGLLILSISGSFSDKLMGQAPEIIDTADDKRPAEYISLSIIGDVSFFAINYDNFMFISPKFYLSGKFGLGFTTNFSLSPNVPTYKYLTIPHHITGNLGRKKNFFEFGLGGTIIAGNISQHFFYYPIIGYRRQPVEKRKLNFRVWIYYPFVMNTNDLLFAPYGLSIGTSF